MTSQAIRIHVELDYESMIADGYTKVVAMNLIAKEWLMTYEEVNDIITAYEHEMEDIDKTGDLGDIL